MKILALPRYGGIGASSRYRLLQFVPLLEDAGHVVRVRSLLKDHYLEQLYGQGRRPAGTVAAGYARRLWQSRDNQSFDTVICEQEAFPYLPVHFDRLAWRGAHRLFLDYDDAAHVRYQRIPLLRGKIARLMAEADGVVVGNSHLMAYAEQFSKRVEVIPTVVDLARYPLTQRVATDGMLRIAWIGTPVTARLLEPLRPVFEKVQKEHPQIVFRFIGAGEAISIKGLRSETPAWSEATEVELLAQCDLGIMPLPDTEFTRGKCGLKLIQFMACWLPVVASPIGVNCEIVTDGCNGFLASGPAEWAEALHCLIANPELRKRMGIKARKRVESRYTLQQGLAKWMSVITESKVAHFPAQTADSFAAAS
jgi:glycosyltransferase involved in cell wall biosynthesis